MQACLIVFTRYPEPGKAKTRLMPLLGPQGAAELHRQLTEHTLRQTEILQMSHAVDVEVRFVGGGLAEMESWLGSGVDYRMQGEGDLGDRMSHAFQSSFDEGRNAVVIIGTDCPELTAPFLEKAFQELQQQDLVLGPAVDGGYYLIGLRRSIPQLFQTISWSTAEVLQQTVDIAEALELAVSFLPALADVDRPADLSVWQRVRETEKQKRDREESGAMISIIIPVLNEAVRLPKTLSTAQMGSRVELLIVDGGSHDATIDVAKAFGAKIIRSQPGRAYQMNAGAKAAIGEILLFLHGDTLLPDGFDRQIRQTIAQPDRSAGAFRLAIDGRSQGLRWVEWGVNWRSQLFQMPYGDQALFLKASLFCELGGFPEQPIMEDVELVRRLKNRGRIAIAPAAVITSDRRWQKLGILKTTLINQFLILAYILGVPPEAIARWYHRW